MLPHIGIDLGGTNVRAGLVGSGGLERLYERPVVAGGGSEGVFAQVCAVIDALGAPAAGGIGVGVPGPYDAATGMVYELINIPAWRPAPLGAWLAARYGVPVRVNNDANCFALAERHFGQGRGSEAFIGLIIGTGMAGGVVLGGRLYEGPNGGAGEFGMMPYLDKYYEHYASGQYFDHAHGLSAREAARRARAGDAAALAMWRAFGGHVGRAVEAILYAYDPERVILGGSVGRAYDLYREAVEEVLAGFAFRRALERLRITVSTLEEPGVLGAAALGYEGG